MEKRTVQKQLVINAPVAAIWEALTNPDLVRQYLFGTNVESDWKKDSPITYSGSWQGKDYEDKGTILDIERNKLLRHTHWSSLSGQPDSPENYYIVSYELEESGPNKTLVKLSQEGNMTKESAEHSGQNWEQVLQKMKEVTEQEMSHH